MSDLAQMIYDKAAADVTERVTKDVTQKVTFDVAKNIARNLLDILDNVSIAQCTNLSIETVAGLRASAALATS